MSSMVWSTRESSRSAVSVSAWRTRSAPTTGKPWPGSRTSGSSADHLAQGDGPLPGVALHLLGVAGVGRRPDEEVAAAQHLRARPPTSRCGRRSRPGRGGARRPTPPTSSVEALGVGAVGVAVLGRPPQPGHPELALVDDLVVAGGDDVAVEARRHGVMGHDDGRGPALGRPTPPPTRPRRRRGRCGRGSRSAVLSRSADHPRSASWTAAATKLEPVSTRTRPSPVAKAETLAKLGTKATPVGDLGHARPCTRPRGGSRRCRSRRATACRPARVRRRPSVLRLSRVSRACRPVPRRAAPRRGRRRAPGVDALTWMAAPGALEPARRAAPPGGRRRASFASASGRRRAERPASMPRPRTTTAPGVGGTGRAAGWPLRRRRHGAPALAPSATGDGDRRAGAGRVAGQRRQRAATPRRPPPPRRCR